MSLAAFCLNSGLFFISFRSENHNSAPWERLVCLLQAAAALGWGAQDLSPSCKMHSLLR